MSFDSTLGAIGLRHVVGSATGRRVGGHRSGTGSVVRRQSIASWIALAFSYGAVVTVRMTWPLVAQLGSALPDTAIPARFDLLLVTWALAWANRQA